MTDESKTQLRQAYQAATSSLRDKHRDEFNTLYSAEAKRRGVEWAPRKTQAEKDAAEFERLLDQHPEFADKIAERLGQKE